VTRQLRRVHDGSRKSLLIRKGCRVVAKKLSDNAINVF
jgi:hypothetical protein